MEGRDLEVDIHDFLQRIQLEQFYDKIHHVLHLTRLSHFDHVTESDLSDIKMSKPEQRRLMDALKKHRKERKKSTRIRFSLRKSKKKENHAATSVNPATTTSPKHGQKSCLILESSLALREELGNGYFGIVRKGTWTTNIGSQLPIAVKSLKYSNCEEFMKEQSDFMREASAMSDFDHANVIHLYGVVLSSPLQLVMELAPLGSLLDRLRQEPQKFLIAKLCDFVLQIASGMTYLESKRYVHRDLAARNLLLASYDKIKIGDFGLMRPLPIDEEIYVMNPQGRVPFAWCAPECLKTRQFSHASDVWSFGITVIEIFSYGKQPWAGLNASQILDLIDEPSCSRPSKPDHCPEDFYSVVMEDCWAHKPSSRSKFQRVKQKLNEVMPKDITMMIDVQNIDDPVKLSAQVGDKVTVITLKSRLGREFGKGQNQRTGQVGYFPIEQRSRGETKTKSSKSPQRFAKVKDISPPLTSSFSHIAHRSEGETPNWGPVMSDERLVVVKQVPLNLPSRLIALRDHDDDSSEGFSDQRDTDVQSMDSSLAGAETSSLSSRDSTHSSRDDALSLRNWSDSGYYSNRTTMLSDYEPMSCSRPINIPGPTTVAPSNHEIRPALPPKKGILTRRQSACSRDSVGTDWNTLGRPKADHPYMNMAVSNTGDSSGHYENIYEAFSTHGTPLDPSLPSDTITNGKFCNQALKNGNPTLTTDDQDIYVEPNLFPTKHCETCSAPKPCACPSLGNRCNTFPEANLKATVSVRSSAKSQSVPSLQEIFKNHTVSRTPGNMTSLTQNLTSAIQNVTSSIQPLTSQPQSMTSPIKQPDRAETTQYPDEILTEEIYENMDHYNVSTVTPRPSSFEIKSPTPPALPTKKRPLLRRHSETSRNSMYKVYACPRSYSISECHYQDLPLKSGSLQKNGLSIGEDAFTSNENFYQNPGNLLMDLKDVSYTANQAKYSNKDLPKKSGEFFIENFEKNGHGNPVEYAVKTDEGFYHNPASLSNDNCTNLATKYNDTQSNDDDGNCDNIYEELPHSAVVESARNKDQGPWVPRNVLSPVDAHAYIEISVEKLRNDDDKHGSRGDELARSGSEADTAFPETFSGISNDFADLDLICAKLRDESSENNDRSLENQENSQLLDPDLEHEKSNMIPENQSRKTRSLDWKSEKSSPARNTKPTPLAHSQSVCQINTNPSGGRRGNAASWKRFSADQDTLSRFTYDGKQQKSAGPASPGNNTNSLQRRRRRDQDNTNGMCVHVSLVTTV